MKMHTPLSITVLMAAALAACENDRRSDAGSNDAGRQGMASSSMQNQSPDAKILSILHCKNQEEIQAAQLARQNSSSESVRSYAEMMIRDHSDADARVMETARQSGITIMDPQTTKMMMMQEKGKSMVDDPIARLGSARGSQFDQMYAEEMHKGHSELVAKLEKMRPKLGDQRVASLVDELLPKIRMHEQHAVALHNMTAPSSGWGNPSGGMQNTNTNMR